MEQQKMMRKIKLYRLLFIMVKEKSIEEDISMRVHSRLTIFVSIRGQKTFLSLRIFGRPSLRFFPSISIWAFPIIGDPPPLYASNDRSTMAATMPTAPTRKTIDFFSIKMWNELTYVCTIEQRPVYVCVYHLIQWFQGIFPLSKRKPDWRMNRK